MSPFMRPLRGVPSEADRHGGRGRGRATGAPAHLSCVLLVLRERKFWSLGSWNPVAELTYSPQAASPSSPKPAFLHEQAPPPQGGSAKPTALPERAGPPN